jgi:hypothetical protein
MSLSVIIADCVLLHCTKNRDLYQRIKEYDLKINQSGEEDDLVEEENDPKASEQK